MILALVGGCLGVVVIIFLLTALTGAPYVPTHAKELRHLFTTMRPLRTTDVVLDIGSGDGIVLREVARRGATAVGYEINIFLVWYARFRLRKHKKAARVELKNLWTAQFPDDVTLVYTFGESRDIQKMYQKVQKEASRLGRPLELLSYGFAVPGKTPTRQHRAHFLYQVSPLHSEEA